MRWLLLSIFVLCLNISNAQTCLNELQANLSEEKLREEPTGLELANYLKQTVELLEPSLPQLQTLPDWFSLDESSEGYELARWLAERNLLVPEWQPGLISFEVWQALIQKLTTWYDLQDFKLPSDFNHQVVTESLSYVVSQVAATQTPVALIASASQDSSQIGFWAVIRNDSIYPRLIVYRPKTDLALSQGAKAVLPFLGSCASQPKHFLLASEEVAKGLFLANHKGEMYLVGTTPTSEQSFALIEQGQETDVLTFQSQMIQNLDHFSVVFSGERVAATTVLRLLPRVRTNMNPKQVLDFVLGR